MTQECIFEMYHLGKKTINLKWVVVDAVWYNGDRRGRRRWNLTIITVVTYVLFNTLKLFLASKKHGLNTNYSSFLNLSRVKRADLHHNLGKINVLCTYHSTFQILYLSIPMPFSWCIYVINRQIHTKFMWSTNPTPGHISGKPYFKIHVP